VPINRGRVAKEPGAHNSVKSRGATFETALRGRGAKGDRLLAMLLWGGLHFLQGARKKGKNLRKKQLGDEKNKVGIM